EATRVRSARTIECAAGSVIRAHGAIRKAGNEGIVRRHADLGVIFQNALGGDVGDGDVAAVLAENQVLAIRRVGDSAVTAARIASECDVVLQDDAGGRVEYFDGLGRAQGEYGRGVSAGMGVYRDRLGPDPDAKVNLNAGWVDDLSIAHDPGTVRLRP